MVDYIKFKYYKDFQDVYDRIYNAFDPVVDQSNCEIINMIYTMLMDDKNYSIYSKNHPFHKYSDYPTTHQNIQALRSDIEAKAINYSQRKTILNFFTPGGVHYDFLEDIMIAYWVFVSNVFNQDANDADNEADRIKN